MHLIGFISGDKAGQGETFTLFCDIKFAVTRAVCRVVAGSENRTSVRSTSSNRNVVLSKTVSDCLGVYPKLSSSCHCW